MNISELKYCKSYVVKFPEFFTKFVPVPDLNIVEENRKAGIKPEADSDEEFVAEDDEDDEDEGEPELPDGNIPIYDPETGKYFTPAIGPEQSSGPPHPSQASGYGGSSGQGVGNQNIHNNPPPNSSSQNPSAPHCEECRLHPLTPEFTLKCKCLLSQACLWDTYENSICIGCKKPLAPQDIEMLHKEFA